MRGSYEYVAGSDRIRPSSKKVHTIWPRTIWPRSPAFVVPPLGGIFAFVVPPLGGIFAFVVPPLGGIFAFVVPPLGGIFAFVVPPLGGIFASLAIFRLKAGLRNVIACFRL